MVSAPSLHVSFVVLIEDCFVALLDSWAMLVPARKLLFLIFLLLSVPLALCLEKELAGGSDVTELIAALVTLVLAAALDSLALAGGFKIVEF